MKLGNFFKIIFNQSKIAKILATVVGAIKLIKIILGEIIKFKEVHSDEDAVDGEPAQSKLYITCTKVIAAIEKIENLLNIVTGIVGQDSSTERISDMASSEMNQENQENTSVDATEKKNAKKSRKNTLKNKKSRRSGSSSSPDIKKLDSALDELTRLLENNQ